MMRRLTLALLPRRRPGCGSATMVIGDRVLNTPSDRTGDREVGSAPFIVKRGR